MPDVHAGIGSTIGSVIPTKGAIIPAAVGVDIGCGMSAVKTSLKASLLPDNLHELRSEIEKRIPHGRTNNGGVETGERGVIQLSVFRTTGIRFFLMNMKKSLQNTLKPKDITLLATWVPLVPGIILLRYA
jgi:hypothetical protein